MAECEFCPWQPGSERWNYRDPAKARKPLSHEAKNVALRKEIRAEWEQSIKRELTSSEIASLEIYEAPFSGRYGHPPRDVAPAAEKVPPLEERVTLNSFVCQRGGCLNDTLICWECMYHNRQLCTKCERSYGPECMDWPPSGSERWCLECTPPKKEQEEKKEEETNEDVEKLVSPCARKQQEREKMQQKKLPVILVVSDGVHFDYARKLAAKLTDHFVVATQFEYTGWPHTDEPDPNLTIWPLGFDVTEASHWKAVAETFGKFRAIIFNNPLIGYFFHRIFAKGSNAAVETWDSIHTLYDGAAWTLRTDNLFYPRAHAREQGEIPDFADAKDKSSAKWIPWEKLYRRIRQDVNDGYMQYYNRWGGTSNGRTFQFPVHYQKTTEGSTRGYQWFMLKEYHRYGMMCLDTGGTIEVNTPGVIASQLKEIGFEKKGGFRKGPYGVDFDVELTHYGWHPSWPMFDHELDGESAPQDGSVSDMNRHVALCE